MQGDRKWEFLTNWIGTRPEAATVKTHVLPFRLYRADASELAEICLLRAATYGRHSHDLAAQLQEPEPADFDPNCEVLVARDKHSGMLLGTLRTHANVFAPIPIEESIDLGPDYLSFRMVETTRLCVLGGTASLTVRSLLFKAIYQYSLQQNAKWMMAAGRSPIDRIYDSLMFQDVEADVPRTFYPLAHAGGIPHRIMSLKTDDVYPFWIQSRHSLVDFFFNTYHPDLDLSQVRSLPPPDSQFGQISLANSNHSATNDGSAISRLSTH